VSKVVIDMSMSLDGFVAGPSGSQLTWRSLPLAPRSCKPDMFGIASSHEGAFAWRE
jgi:hypothetical protein